MNSKKFAFGHAQFTWSSPTTEWLCVSKRIGSVPKSEVVSWAGRRVTTTEDELFGPAWWVDITRVTWQTSGARARTAIGHLVTTSGGRQRCTDYRLMIRFGFSTFQIRSNLMFDGLASIGSE